MEMVRKIIKRNSKILTRGVHPSEPDSDDPPTYSSINPDYTTLPFYKELVYESYFGIPGLENYSHLCMAKGCIKKRNVFQKAFSFEYIYICPEHSRCNYSGCTKRRYTHFERELFQAHDRGTTIFAYCLDHKCYQNGCNSLPVPKHRACKIHLCHLESCFNENDPYHSDYCKNHQCSAVWPRLNIRCRNLAKPGNSYCERHECEDETDGKQCNRECFKNSTCYMHYRFLEFESGQKHFTY